MENSFDRSRPATFRSSTATPSCLVTRRSPAGWRGLCNAIGDDKTAVESGVANTSRKTGNTYDMLRGRVVFPIRDLAGDVIGFAGRKLPVVSSAKRTVMGFEWSWTPPKSVSALWALADPETRGEIEAAYEVADAAALAEVEKAAAWTRRRRGRRLVRERTEGLLAVVVPHTSSRDGDPHLHHHVVVANQVRRVGDGQWATLDARGLYGSVAWAATVWAKTLRAELTVRLGVEWGFELSGGGGPQIVGMPSELVELWSKRAQAIREELDRRREKAAAKAAAGGDDVERELGGGVKLHAGAAKQAATETRRSKDLSETRVEKFGRWQAEALDVGFVADEVVGAVTGRDVAVRRRMSREELVGAVAVSVYGRLNSWDRVEWLSTAAEVGAELVDVSDMLDAAESELGDGGRWAVQLPDDPAGSCIGGRWTTSLTLARERRVIGRAMRMAEPGESVVAPWEVADAVEAAGLDAEQGKAVWDMALSGRRFYTLAAPAGAGKTRTMGALAEVLGHHGIKLRALAVAQKATDKLGDAFEAAEPQRRNISRFLAAAPDPDVREWWVVDEASVVDSRQWDALLARAEESGTPVVAIGDPRQLGSVGPGGLYAVMVDHPELPTAELEQVWRMEAEWEKAASLKLRAMDPAAVDAYAEHGRIRDHDDLEELLDGLAAVHADGLDVVVLAGSNRRVDELNDAMQARVVGDRDPDDEMGIRWDDGEGVVYARTVGVGDRIRTRRNDYDLVTSRNEPVVNGATWGVTHVRDGGLWVRAGDRGHVFLPPAYLEERDDETGRPFVELAYASTVHSAQGLTVDRAVMMVGAYTRAEMLYVGMTRGRSSNIAVAEAGDDDGLTLFQAAAANPSADAVAALELVAHHRRDKAKRKARERAEREQAEAARKAAREPTLRVSAPDTTERDIEDEQDEDLYALVALADARLAHQEQERIAREREAAAAKAEAARKAAIAAAVQQWVQDLPDGLSTDQVAADAEQQWWGPDVDAPVVADAYRSVQNRAATRWVQSVWAGYHTGSVVDAARKRFAVGDDPGGRFEEAYQAAAQQRLAAGNGWLDEHGSRPDDDQQGDSRPEAVAKFGIIPEQAKKMVDDYNTRQRAAAAASVEQLLADRTPGSKCSSRPSWIGAEPDTSPTPWRPWPLWNQSLRPRNRRPNSVGGAG